MAIGLGQDARKYLDAAAHLDLADDAYTHAFAPPTYFLICHSIELALKAYLASHGLDERRLMRIGHRLERALEEAKKAAFSPAGNRFEELVQWLAPYHAEHSFRYRQLGYFRLPNARESIDIVEPVIDYVEAGVRARYMDWRSAHPSQSAQSQLLPE
jgi:HEPN domain-containing protein